MKQVSSLVNFGILKNNLRRFYLIGVASFLVLFFTLPFTFFVNKEYFANTYMRSLGRNNFMLNQLQFEGVGFLGLFVVCMLAFALALVINRYLNVQNSAIFNHSLPVGKKSLYVTNYLTGLIIMIVPIVLVAIILVAEKYIFSFIMYRCLHVLKWMALLSLCAIFIYTVTNIISMLTGSTVFAGLLSGAALSFEYLIGLGIIATLEMFVRGAYFMEGEFEDIFLNITPFTRIIMLERKSFSMLEIIMYVLIIIALFIAGLFIYKNRKTETATETFSFEILKPIFKYIVTFLSSLALGLIFVLLTNYNIVGTIIGYLLGLIIGYFLAEMIIMQNIHVFSKYKGCLISIFALVILALCIKFDVTGYERRVPKLEDVKSANFRSDVIDYIYDADGTNNVVFKNTQVEGYESIEKIIKLHENLVDTSLSNFETSKLQNEKDCEIERKYIVYELKNGKRLVREFNYIEEENRELLKEVYEDDEYQYATYRKMFEYDKEAFYELRLESNFIDTEISIKDIDKTDELISNIKKDALNQKYENINSTSLFTIRMYSINKEEYERFVLENPNRSKEDAKNYAKESVCYVNIDPTYTNTINWIKQNGYENALLFSKNNLKKAIIYKLDYEENVEYMREVTPSMIYTEEKVTYSYMSDEEKFKTVLNSNKYYDLSIEEVYDILENTNNKTPKEYSLMIKFDVSNIQEYLYSYRKDVNTHYYEIRLSKDEIPSHILETLETK